MRIIISPAKQMRVNTDAFICSTLPVFLEKTEILMRWIQGLSYEEQKKLLACSDKIAGQNAERFAHMDLRQNLTPALLSYDGIQYTYMPPAVFEDGQYDYVQDHLRILSGRRKLKKRLKAEITTNPGLRGEQDKTAGAKPAMSIPPKRQTEKRSDRK